METQVAVRVASEYRELAERLRDADLLRRRPVIAAARISLTLIAFIAGWIALVATRTSWLALAVGAFLAVMSTQVLFLGHDAGHQQTFRTRRANHRFGLIVGNLLMGLSYGWWLPKHNAHHLYPNQIGRDPDIGPQTAARRAEHAPAAPRPQPSLFVVIVKAITLLPRILLEFGMHLSSGRALAQRRDRKAITEWLLIAAHTAVYLSAVFWLLAPLHAIAFIAVQQVLFGIYLRVAFAPNHKGMPIFAEDSDVEFVERQVVTARNVAGGWFLSFVLGGLNYQIEHHLFPSMPRPNLARAQPIVRTFCLERGIPYREDTVIDSYREAIHSLLPA
jgi:fatty acid desaturase